MGLPLAVEFGKHYDTVGFDVKATRIAQLRRGRDVTLEVTTAELKGAKRLSFTTDLKKLKRCQVFIVTVPTPIDEYKRPDLTRAHACQRERRRGVAAAARSWCTSRPSTPGAPKRSACRSSSGCRA